MKKKTWRWWLAQVLIVAGGSREEDRRELFCDQTNLACCLEFLTLAEKWRESKKATVFQPASWTGEADKVPARRFKSSEWCSSSRRLVVFKGPLCPLPRVGLWALHAVPEVPSASPYYSEHLLHIHSPRVLCSLIALSLKINPNR